MSRVDAIIYDVCDNFFINLITTNGKVMADLEICKETKKDNILREVFLRVFSGNWPKESKVVSKE